MTPKGLVIPGLRRATDWKKWTINPSRPTVLLMLILGLVIVRGLVYASVTPAWQAPDEPKHFEYLALMHEKGRLISEKDRSPALQQEILASMRANDYWRYGYANSPPEATNSFFDIYKMSPTQLARPPLYYVAASPFYRLAAGLSMEARLYIARLFSVLLSVLTVWMTFLTVRTVFPRHPSMALLAASFVAFVPMFTFISSSVNSDNMANLLTAVLAYVLARVFVAGSTVSRAFAILVLLIAGIWTKRTTLFAAPLVAFSALAYEGGRLFFHSRRMLAGTGAGLIVAIISIVALAPARAVVGRLLDNYVFNVSAEANLSGFVDKEYTVAGLVELYYGFIGRMFDSFWAQFGWMNVRVGDTWYIVLLLFCLLSVAGLARLAWLHHQGRELLEAPQRKLILLCVVWIFLVLGITLLQYTADYNPKTYPQGRYLYTALTPIALIFALGLRNLLPERFGAATVFTAITFLFLFDSVSFALYLLPFYYQPL